ncbi:MAG: HlyD family efflux transporter periplasmic adaptor subunit [Burkholderiales bacterium]|nr:HlyD family efflux transporter periplasmic adaptor subunit [Burkholderiales bacterium]
MLFIYIVAYFLPITNQAIVSNSSVNVFSKSGGIIDKVLVKNGQYLNNGESALIIKNQGLENEYSIAKQQLDETITLLGIIKSRIIALNSNLTRANLQLNNFQKILIENNNEDDVSGINERIKTQQNIVIELQKQLGLSNTELIKIQTQSIIYNKQLDMIKDEINALTVRAENSGYIQDLMILQGSKVDSNQKLFTLIHPENQKIIAYFSENDLQKIHEGDKVMIFPRAYLGSHQEDGEIVAGNWSIPVSIVESTNQRYLINSPKRIPVEISVTSQPNTKYPLDSGMSVYVYVIGK